MGRQQQRQVKSKETAREPKALQLKEQTQEQDTAEGMLGDRSLRPTNRRYSQPPEPPPKPNFRGLSQELRAELAKGLVVQTKMTLGQPNDKYEQEADEMAAQVVETINPPHTSPSIQQEQTEAEIGKIQRKPGGLAASDGGMAVSGAIESRINSARGGGKALDPGLQQSMGQAMGEDLSGVRVHTDATSDRLNRSLRSQAFTSERDVFFKQGTYQPGTKEGQQLIAHELTHVLQQKSPGNQRGDESNVRRKVTLDKNDNVPLTIEQVMELLDLNMGLQPKAVIDKVNAMVKNKEQSFTLADVDAEISKLLPSQNNESKDDQSQDNEQDEQAQRRARIEAKEQEDKEDEDEEDGVKYPTIKKGNDPKAIKEGYYASEQGTLTFSGIDTCIGLVGRNKLMLTGVHLVLFDKNDVSLLNLQDMDIKGQLATNVMNILKNSEEIIAVGRVSEWEESAPFFITALGNVINEPLPYSQMIYNCSGNITVNFDGKDWKVTEAENRYEIGAITTKSEQGILEFSRLDDYGGKQKLQKPVNLKIGETIADKNDDMWQVIDLTTTNNDKGFKLQKIIEGKPPKQMLVRKQRSQVRLFD